MYSPVAASRSVLAAQASSRLVTQMVKGSHKFEIEGYSLTKGMGVGKFIASKYFHCERVQVGNILLPRRNRPPR